LEELCERGGSLEVAVAREGGGSDLIWRLRIISVSDDGIVVETPSALGRTVKLSVGTRLVAFIVVGQNRWQFETSIAQLISPVQLPAARFGALELELPDTVQRCMRQHTRVDVGALQLPQVDLWPLLDPKSVVAAERASELAFTSLQLGRAIEPSDDDALLPTVGPRFFGHLANIGGGGAGLVVEPAEAGTLNRHRVFWVRLPLGDTCPVPIVCTAKLVHTHMDSAQRTYAGLSFDFTFNPAHQKTVAAQVERSIHALEARQRA
jgi:hypothetical protein